MKSPNSLITNSLIKKSILIIAFSLMVWQVADLYSKESGADTTQQIKNSDKK